MVKIRARARAEGSFAKAIRERVAAAAESLLPERLGDAEVGGIDGSAAC